MGKSNITHGSRTQSSSQDLVLSVMIVGSYTWHWFRWFPPYYSLFWCLQIFSRGCRLGCTAYVAWCQWAALSPPGLLTLVLPAFPFTEYLLFSCVPAVLPYRYRILLFHIFKIFYYFTYLPGFCSICQTSFLLYSPLSGIYLHRKKNSTKNM